MYEETFGHYLTEEVVEKDDIEFTLSHRAPPSISSLEQSLGEGKSMYQEVLVTLLLRQ